MSAQSMETPVTAPKVTIYVGDARDVLKTLPAQSIDCCVTSPPYLGLRDYGTGTWEGGDPACDHKVRRPETRAKSKASSSLTSSTRDVAGHEQQRWSDVCHFCGARRVDRQIGLEASVDAYIAELVAVFREVHRVLKPHGSLWLNLGDSYAGSGKGPTGKYGCGHHERQGFDSPGARRYGLKAKDLMLIPWRVAIALQDDGWYVRSVVAWTKLNPMPESVTDRPTNAWEPVMLLTRCARYYYDAEAVRQPVAESTSGVNLRNVWQLSSEPFSAAALGVDTDHYATFPTEIPRRAISAGSSERGVCAKCGKPWVRRVIKTFEPQADVSAARVAFRGKGARATRDTFIAQSNWQGVPRGSNRTTTTGWQPSCKCAAPTVRAVVLDPFAGAGTTLLVANRLGRDAIGIELNAKYAEMARRRIEADAGLFANIEVL